MVFNLPDVEVLPPSDFKDLLIAILDLEQDTDEFIRQISLLQASFNMAVRRSSAQLRIAEQILGDIDCQEKRYSELDTHYGWVLASDYACVAKAFGQDGVAVEDARAWINGVCGKYGKMSDALRELEAGFRQFIRDALEEDQSSLLL
jgi:hypothetical protein